MILLPYNTIVRCENCSFPIHFGSGFWWRRPGFRNGANQEAPARVTVICGRCAKFRRDPDRVSQAKIRHTTGSVPVLEVLARLRNPERTDR